MSASSTAAAVSSWLCRKTAEDVFLEPLKAGSVLATRRRLQLLQARRCVVSIGAPVSTARSSRLGQFRDHPTEVRQAAPGTMELALLSHRGANIIKIPDISASVSQSKECMEYF